MKIKTLLALTLTILLTRLPAQAADAPAGWEQMKMLVGTWTAKDGQEITYKLISNGSALMETSNCKGTEMVTVYHPDGKNVMMTHYCAAQNQPRMKAMPGKGAPQCCLSFNLVEVTNLSSPDATHMTKLLLTFKDDNHFTQTWTVADKGKNQNMVIDYERKP